jgi:sialic acid synthase SpsE
MRTKETYTMNLADTHLAIMNMLAEQMTYGLVIKVGGFTPHSVSFTYDAAGAAYGTCWATVVINDDMSITHDDLEFANLDAWLANELDVRNNTANVFL